MTIVSLFPSELKALLQEIEDQGFVLCLVGGAVRDYLSNQILSKDLDFEVRKMEIGKLKAFLKSKNLSFSVLPYEILRVDFRGYDLEFSLPRTERAIAGNTTHHHFEAVLEQNLSYKEAFIRRDFTINAIGIEITLKDNRETIIDPFNGVSDLKNKVLREISDDFFLDSVRFLRLVRFHVKYHFAISESIKDKMVLFNLKELSVHHFKKELEKSGAPGLFINVFNELITNDHIEISDSFKFWGQFKFTSNQKDQDDLLVFVFFQDEQKASLVSSFFSMPEKKLKDLKSFSDSFINVSKIKVEELISLVQKPLSEVWVHSLFKDLKNLEEKKMWRKYFSQKLLISWSDWENINIDRSEVENTPLAQRSCLKYYHAIKKVVGQ